MLPKTPRSILLFASLPESHCARPLENLQSIQGLKPRAHIHNSSLPKPPVQKFHLSLPGMDKQKHEHSYTVRSTLFRQRLDRLFRPTHFLPDFTFLRKSSPPPPSSSRQGPTNRKCHSFRMGSGKLFHARTNSNICALFGCILPPYKTRFGRGNIGISSFAENGRG